MTAEHGPTVGPDDDGVAGPLWTIIRQGHTVRGWPWFVIRKRGGLVERVTIHGARNTPEDTAAVIARRVASMKRVVDPYD